jgi:hypothetical protein
MTGCLARYAKDKPEKPFSEVREEVWKKVIKDRESKDGRREKDLCEPENEAEK